MSNMSDWLEARLASHIFGTGTFSKPPAIAVALTVTPPTDADTGASARELPNSGAYARQAVTQNASNWTDPVATDGICYNLSTITFPVATTQWGWISGSIICDSSSYAGGNSLVWGTLQTPKFIDIGDQLKINVSGLVLTFA